MILKFIVYFFLSLVYTVNCGPEVTDLENSATDTPKSSSYIRKLSRVVSKPTERIVKFVEQRKISVRNTIDKSRNKVSAIVEDQILNRLRTVDETCESVVVDGKLEPTPEGLLSCENKCNGLPNKIRNAIATIGKRTPSIFNLKKYFLIVVNEDPNLKLYNCVPNMTNDALLCDCPQAARIYLSEKAQKHFDVMLSGGTNKRDFIILPGIILIILAFVFCPIWVPILILTSPIWLPIMLGCFG